MGLLRNCEHLERRIDRHYLLAAAAKIPGIRQLHLGRARYYRKLLEQVRGLANPRVHSPQGHPPFTSSTLVEG